MGTRKMPKGPLFFILASRSSSLLGSGQFKAVIEQMTVVGNTGLTYIYVFSKYVYPVQVNMVTY